MAKRRKKGRKVWCPVDKSGRKLGPCSKSKRSARKIREARGGKGSRVTKRRRPR